VKDEEDEELLEKLWKVKEKMRLKAKGFSMNPVLGFTFPGVNPTKYRKKTGREKEGEPAMKVGPITAEGKIGIDFTHDMIAPEAIN
jgi:hypothetical protein